MKIIYILFLNVFFLVIAKYLGVERTILNYDYLVIVIFYLYFRNRYIAFVLFFICILFDCINIFFQIFPVIHLLDLFYILKFIPNLDHSKKILILASISFLGFYLFFLFKILDNIKFSKKYSMYGVLIIILLSILQSFYIVDGDRAWRVGQSKYFDSQIYNFIKYRRVDFIKKFNNSEQALGERFKSETGYDEILKKKKVKKILFIINESWGISKFDVQADILSDLNRNKKFKILSLSEIDTDGFTLNAEIRELCGRYLLSFNLKNQKQGFENCLPNILVNQGYELVSFHGAAGTMYDRRLWYPKVGFKESYFYENFLEMNSKCYSFPGMCDRDLMPIIRNKLIKTDKIFLYWLTLNTHFSYDLRDLKKDSFNCIQYQIQNNLSLCRNLKLQKQFFSNISELIIRDELSQTLIIIVGDHVPPLLENENQFFKNNKVPMIMGYVD